MYTDSGGRNMTKNENPNVIEIVIIGSMTKKISYVEGETRGDILEKAGIDLGHIDHGEVSIDGEVIFTMEDMSKKIEKEQLVIVGEKAANGNGK